jgi:hypothetical protein
MSDSDQKKALEIMRETAAKLEPLYDYVPNRPLGWLDHMMTGILEELEWKVENEDLYWSKLK